LLGSEVSKLAFVSTDFEIAYHHFEGTGFDVRNTSHVDVEEDVDIDGADEAVFGEAQFTERDVIAGEDAEVDIGDADDLRNLVAGPQETQNAEIENEVARAREAGDMPAMQTALGKRGLNIVSQCPLLISPRQI
jgi:hypothetical protein